MLTLNLYILLSALLLGGTVINSFSIHEQFYPTMIHLISNKSSKIIILNFFFMIYITVSIAVVHIVLGEIKVIERVNVLEKLKRKIIDVILIFIYFRDETLDTSIFFVFILLLIFNILQWLAIKRSEHLVGEGGGTLIRTHLKLCFYFLFLITINTILYKQSLLNQNFYNKEKQQLNQLYRLELVINNLKLVQSLLKYLINIFELLTFSNFDSKNTILQVLDFIFTTTKILVRLYGFNFLRQKIGLPIHIIADIIEDLYRLYQTFKNFFKSIKLIHQLSQLDDVTEKDIREIDNICLICLSEMKTGKKINCGHIFHFGCLRNWVQGAVNQKCPKCNQALKLDELVLNKKLKNEQLLSQPQPFNLNLNDNNLQYLDKNNLFLNQNEINNNDNININKSGNQQKQTQSLQYQRMELEKLIQLSEQELIRIKNQQNATQKIRHQIDDIKLFQFLRKIHVQMQMVDNLSNDDFIQSLEQDLKSDSDLKSLQGIINLKQFAKTNSQQNQQAHTYPAVQYGLPKEAVYNRTFKDQCIKMKIELMNNMASKFQTNPELINLLFQDDFHQQIMKKNEENYRNGEQNNNNINIKQQNSNIISESSQINEEIIAKKSEAPLNIQDNSQTISETLNKEEQENEVRRQAWLKKQQILEEQNLKQ